MHKRKEYVIVGLTRVGIAKGEEIMEKKYNAHIRKEGESEKIQTLEEHIRNTGKYAGMALKEVGLYATAYLSGLLHDMGKATETFQDYLRRASNGETVRKGSVNHTFAGVRFLLTQYKMDSKWGEYGPMTAELIAYAVGAHHGLFDCIDENGKSGFEHRLEKENIHYNEAIANYLDECATKEEVDRWFGKAVKEVETFFAAFLKKVKVSDRSEISFYVGLLERLLVSAVMDGDSSDTGEFMSDFPHISELPLEERKANWGKMLARIENKLGELPKEKEIQKARGNISDICRSAAEKQGGVYRLNVPTGGGKTLCSLRYAVAHAEKYGKNRIIFTSPLLSILNQNAKEIRKYVQDDEAILEHHSNIIHPTEEYDTFNLSELLTATWQKPIIITTLVQLLNTMFDGGRGSIRRFHALSGSVIVIDEVQTVPFHLMSLFHLTVTFLAEACGATVILCSATQPCTEAAAHPIAAMVGDLVAHNPDLWNVFKRTCLQDMDCMDVDELADFTETIMEEADSLLIVCNKKQEAETLYRRFSEEKFHKYYISAAMCTAHRQKILDEVKMITDDIQNNGLRLGQKKVICVSTQVMEAGVDLSFDRSIRLLAGMDSAIQTAGRQNRNGKYLQPVPAYLIPWKGEDLRYLPEIQWEKNAVLALLEEFHRKPENFKNDLMSDEAISYYYRQLYRKEIPGEIQDGPVKKYDTTLYSLLSENVKFLSAAPGEADGSYALNQAFQTAGTCFKVFEQNTEDVLVPYGKGRDLITELVSLSLPYDLLKVKRILEEAKPYTISIYEWQKRCLEARGALITLCQGEILALQEGIYHEILGLTKETGSMEFLEV